MNNTAKWTALWEVLKKKWPLLLLALLGILLLLSGMGKEETIPSQAGLDAESYRKETEGRLAALCGEIAGVGKVSVMITLESGEELVYAADRTAQGGVDYVTQGGGLLCYRRYPAVAGAVVVAAGARDPSVEAKLLQAVHAALGIPYSRICICAAGKG